MDANLADDQAWADDALGRHWLAQYLTRSLVAQSTRQAKVSRGLTVSLDATWGAGKTFFVTHWVSDLRAAGHPVVYFDAWENDIGDEASVALMAAILEGLDEWREQLPVSVRVGRRATALRKDVTGKLRRMIAPTAAVLTKGILKKVTGVAFDEISDAWLQDDADDSTTNSTSEKTDELLDKVFEQQLEAHRSRKESLVSFKASLTELINLVTEKTSAELPIFIFIDELDRCRPLYAIKLLEEVKHIFGVVNIVYVISTNLEQLQNSVRALYGSEFDGAGYLRRLFDREYLLPIPDNGRFAKNVFVPGSALNEMKVREWRPTVDRRVSSAESAWAAVADAAALDLRSQKQVFALADEVATSLLSKEGIAVIWLFFLCVLFFRDKALLKSVAHAEIDVPEFEKQCAARFDESAQLKYKERSKYHSWDDKSIPIVDIFSSYYELIVATRPQLIARQDSADTSFPKRLAFEFFDELMNASANNEVSIRYYASHVLSSGFVMGQANDDRRE